MAASHWIWSPEWIHEDKKSPRIVYFRRAFTLHAVPEKAEIRITADTRYKLYVNGKLVEVGPSRGDREVWFVDTVDLSPFLKTGKNIIGVSVLRYPAERELGNHGMFRSEIPGLFVQYLRENPKEQQLDGGLSSGGVCEAARNDDGSALIDAGPAWTCHIDRWTRFPREEERFAPLMIHENAAGNPETHRWLDEDFDDTMWVSAKAYPESMMNEAIAPANINPRTIPYMYRRKRHFSGLIEGDPAIDGKYWHLLLAGRASVTIPANTKIRIVLNAGEEMTGYLKAAFAGGKNAAVCFLESEAYVQDEVSPTSGTPIKKNRMDTVHGHLMGYTDRYLVAGLGTEEKPEIFEPYWFRTFRFIELTIDTKDEPLTILSLNYEETGYPLEVRTRVETSDPSLKDIWDISERTLRRCMHESYEDCPFYEQLQYTMDTRAQILYTYAVSADDRLARKAIDDFSRAQRSNGLLNCSYPNMNPNVIPGFSIFYILMVHDHMMYFGDQTLVRRYMPTIDKILNYFDRHLTPEGLVEKVGGINGKARYWSFIDWATEWNPTEGMPPAGTRGPITMESLLYVYGLMHAAELAQYIGRMDTANEYRARAMDVQKAVRRYCRRADGMLTDGPVSGLTDWTDRAADLRAGDISNLHTSQQAQVFGILTGTIDPETGREYLLRTMTEEGHPQCTVAMRFYLFRAFERTGLYRHTDHCWDAWRTMVADNCTTCIESEDYARSECHAWGALALYELPSAILGVRPAAPGYREIAVCPHAEFLEHAAGVVRTPVGDVTVSWKKDGGRVNLSVDAPEGVKIRY